MATKRTISTKSKKPAQAAKKPVPAAKATAVKVQPAKAPVANSVATGNAKPAKAERPATTEKSKKSSSKKQKTIRDSFNMPADDYALIALLKKRAAGSGREIKKSELLRAGLKALFGMNDGTFVQSIGSVHAVKTGRPTKKAK